MDKIILFHHIPKTGGANLYKFFEEKFNAYAIEPRYEKKQKVIYEGWWKQVKKIINDKNSSPILICGHSVFGVDEILRNKKCEYITIFREPITRVISHYNFQKFLHKIDDETNLIDWVTNLKDYYFKQFFVKDINEFRKLLEEKIFLFGFTEMYEDFLLLFKYFYNLDEIKISVKNKNINLKINVSEDEISHLKTILKNDILAYNIANEVYDSKFKSVLNRLKKNSYNVLIYVEKNSILPDLANINKKFNNPYIDLQNLSKKLEIERNFIKAFKVLNKVYPEKFSTPIRDFIKRNRLEHNNNFRNIFLDIEKEIESELKKAKNFITNNISYINIYYFNLIWDFLYFRNILNQSYNIDFLLNYNFNHIYFYYSPHFFRNYLTYIIFNKKFFEKNEKKLIIKFLGLKKTDKIAIFGAAKAGEITYNLLNLLDIKIEYFIDDFKKGENFGVSIINRKNLKEKRIDKIIIGPCQKGNFEELIKNYETILL